MSVSTKSKNLASRDRAKASDLIKMARANLEHAATLLSDGNAQDRLASEKVAGYARSLEAHRQALGRSVK